MFREQIDVFERDVDVMEAMPLSPLSVKKTEQLVCVMSGDRTHLFFQRSRTFIKFRQTIFVDGVRKYVINTLEMPLFAVHRKTHRVQVGPKLKNGNSYVIRPRT